MLIAHKIALQPNNRQRTYFAKACGVARFAFNWALDNWQKQYQAYQANNDLPKPSEMALRRQLNAIKRLIMTVFKFGDRVSHPQYGNGIFLGYNGEDFAWVLTKFQSFSNYSSFTVEADELSLIPNPDTARLDWIEQCSHTARETAILYDGHSWRGYINEDTPIELGFPCETLRQAVDEAMNNAPDTTTQP